MGISKEEMHPATRDILSYFGYKHLPVELQPVSSTFHQIAWAFATSLEGPEVTVGLRKLLEAKDCFVRAAFNANKH